MYSNKPIHGFLMYIDNKYSKVCNTFNDRVIKRYEKTLLRKNEFLMLSEESILSLFYRLLR